MLDPRECYVLTFNTEISYWLRFKRFGGNVYVLRFCGQEIAHQKRINAGSFLFIFLTFLFALWIILISDNVLVIRNI